MTWRVTTSKELIDVDQIKRAMPAFEELVHNTGHQIFKEVDIDPVKLYNWIKEHEYDPRVFTRLVMDQQDTVVGGIAGSLDTYIYSSEIHAFERMFYLDPTVKDRTLVVPLLDTFVRWAIEARAVDVIIGNSTGINLVGFDKLAKHLGFIPATLGYVRRLK